MKNQVTRTILLPAVSITLFAVILWAPVPKNLPLSDVIRYVSGGKIWVKSEKGEGSTFYFTLPVN